MRPASDSCSDLQDAFLGENILKGETTAAAMGNRESKEAAAHAAKQREREAQFEAKSDAQVGLRFDLCFRMRV